ncbi:MAG: hypothetical protein KJO07_20340 [Deltaproteobacteria bacterium]|nr:hypothetical protein [Deltaproteobacteria bacterium]
MDDETYILWQDVFDEIAAGRPNNISCPKCGQGPLKVEQSPASKTKISCPSCGAFLEGSIGFS